MQKLNFRRMQYTNIRTIILVQLHSVKSPQESLEIGCGEICYLPSAFIVAGLGCGLSSRPPTGIAVQGKINGLSRTWSGQIVGQAPHYKLGRIVHHSIAHGTMPPMVCGANMS